MQCYNCKEEFKPEWVAVRRSARLNQHENLKTCMTSWQISGIIRAICPFCGEDNDRSVSQNIDPCYLLRLVARQEGD